jgi:predicted  nucleic acid-binding Zn-ribbon protein
VQQVSKQYADQIANLEKRITKQEKDFKEERAGYVEREKRSVEEMADMKGKVKWMANKMNEQKRKIIWLSIGLVLALALAVYLMVR